MQQCSTLYVHIPKLLVIVAFVLAKTHSMAA